MCRLSYKHNYQFQNVRHQKVLEALKYLVQTSELFQKEKIEVQDNWIENIVSKDIAEVEEWQEFSKATNEETDSPSIASGDTISSPLLLSEPDVYNETSEDREVIDMSNSNLNDDEDDGWYRQSKFKIMLVSHCVNVKVKKKIYKAGDLKSEDYLSKLAHADEGYTVFINLKEPLPYL